jgi:hypothetical protein
MKTVPQPRQAAAKPLPQWPALTGALDRLGTAQMRAIVAWHGRRGMSDLDADIQQVPTYPLIPCSAQPCSFAPPRSTPRGAA